MYCRIGLASKKERRRIQYPAERGKYTACGGIAVSRATQIKYAPVSWPRSDRGLDSASITAARALSCVLQYENLAWARDLGLRNRLIFRGGSWWGSHTTLAKGSTDEARAGKSTVERQERRWVDGEVSRRLIQQLVCIRTSRPGLGTSIQ